MSFATPVAILGFTPFERSTFEAFLRLAARRTPAYELQTDPFSADFVIVDADDPVLVKRVLAGGFLPRSVLLGARPHAGAALHLERPFNLMQMLRSLDGLPRPVRVAQGAAGWPAPVPGPLAPRAAVRIPLPAASLSLGAASAHASRAGWPGSAGP